MEKALQTMLDNIPEKTGKTLDEWKKIVKATDLVKFSEHVKFLKSEHGVTHGYANLIANVCKEENNSDEDLVELQYRGKELLLPIYKELIKFSQSLGGNVKITPKKGSVSVIRKRQFILIKPATKTRIDLGFKLKDKDVGERLQGSGPFGTMCTHRVQVNDISEIDNELKDWIKEAYDKSK